jgi:transposase
MIRELYQNGRTEDKLPERNANKKKKEWKLDPNKNDFLQRIQEGTTNCVVLLEKIHAMGYTGKITIVRDFVRLYRELPKKQATIQYEYQQVNKPKWTGSSFESIWWTFNTQDIYTFEMVLGYSRMKYVEFTTNVNMENFNEMSYERNCLL